MVRNRDTYAEYDYEDEEYSDDGETYASEDGGDGSWWDEGLISLTILVGAILFFFPEPATSTIGIGLILIGAIAWLVDSFA